MKGTTKIRAICTQCHIGCTDAERGTRQPILIHIEYDADWTNALESCDLVDAVDYAAMAEKIRSFVEGGSYALVESLVRDVARFCLDSYPIERIHVEIVKQPVDMPGVECITASVELVRADFPDGFHTI